MATNELLRFANGEAANVVTFQDWLGRSEVTNGFVAGIARSAHMNRIFAQGALASFVMGQLIVSQLDQDAKLEDSDFYTKFLSALVKYVPANVADSSINGAKIIDASLNAAKIIDATITAAKLVDKTISTAKIADLAITAAKIASKTITQAQIADATLTFAKLATEAIATTEQALSGTDNDVLMTPIRTKEAIGQFIPPSVPSGVMVPFAGTNVPDGWLLCNGAEVSRTTYASLFAAIGTKWGSGDGVSTFTLPLFHKRFAEGTTNPDEVGTYVEAGAPNITGDIIVYTAMSGGNSASGAFTLYDGGGSGESSSYRSTRPKFSFSAFDSNAIYSGSTIQPVSSQALMIIKE